MRVSLILAIARNGVIGRDNQIPWRISSDMRRFRTLTLGKPIVMGRKQYESVGKPLAGRDNIVLTRDSDFSPPGVHVVRDMTAAIALGTRMAQQHGAEEIMIIGGAQIYALAMQHATRIYLSTIEADVEGDVRFDLPDLSRWRTVATESCAAGPKDEHAHTFTVLERP